MTGISTKTWKQICTYGPIIHSTLLKNTTNNYSKIVKKPSTNDSGDPLDDPLDHFGVRGRKFSDFRAIYVPFRAPFGVPEGALGGSFWHMFCKMCLWALIFGDIFVGRAQVATILLFGRPGVQIGCPEACLNFVVVLRPSPVHPSNL